MPLPRLFMEIMNDLGQEAAFRMIDALGGQRRYIPINPAGSVIEEAAGASIAAALSSRYGGEHVSFPAPGGAVMRLRREAYIRARPECSANELARELGIGCRTVEQIRSEIRSLESLEK